MKIINLHKFTIATVVLILLNSCGIYKYTDQRNQPSTGLEKARKNIEEGKGIGIKGMIGSRNTNYEFSSSNPMWRAALELIEFMPLTTVDYSGGIIITDWYSDNSNKNESLKITIRFLSNEIASNNLKIIVHKKQCKNENCSITISNSKVKEELTVSILRKAAIFEKDKKKK